MPILQNIELHEIRTGRSGYQYQFTPKHHGQDAQAARWLPELSLEEEFAVFGVADQFEIADDDGWLYGVQPEADGLRELGTWSQQVAAFPHAREGEAWHGYPLFPLDQRAPQNRQGERMRPSKAVFRRMHEAGLITTVQQKRLMKGGPCMSQNGPNGNVRVPPYREWSSFPEGFEVSWVGPGFHADEFCLGSEDGRLMFIHHVGEDRQLMPSALMDSEAVNGVAFAESTFAVSTRKEIAFVTRPLSGGAGTRGIFPYGAHGIIATTDGAFVAPLGLYGLMTTRPTTSDIQATKFNRIQERPLNYYKAVSVVSRTSPELIVCAARKDGVVAAPITSDGLTGAWVMTLPGLDVVDVCPLGPTPETPAVVALGKDGTLALFHDVLHDVLHDAAPTTIQYGGIEGTAYRVLVVQGTIIMLTSQGLYFLHGLAQRFLQGNPVDMPIPTQERHLEAVDANTADDRWLFIVKNERVIRLDVPQFIAAIPHGAVESAWTAQAAPVSGAWEMAEGLPLASEQGELIAA